MVKHKGYSLINVLALTVGIAACGLVLLYVLFETSVDTYHKDVDRIYRVGLYRKTAQGEDVLAGNYTPLAPALKEQYPQVEYAAQVLRVDSSPSPSFTATRPSRKRTSMRPARTSSGSSTSRFSGATPATPS